MRICPSIFPVILSAFLLFSCVGGKCTYSEPVRHEVRITRIEPSGGFYIYVYFEKNGKEDSFEIYGSKELTPADTEEIKTALKAKGLYPGAEVIIAEEFIKSGTCTPVVRGFYDKSGKIRIY